MLAKLNMLDLKDTQVSDAGCAALAAALDRGALPALEALDLFGIPASDASKAAVKEALERSTARAAALFRPESVILRTARCGLAMGL